MKAARKRLGVLPRSVRWAQVGPKPCARRWGRAATTRAILLRPTCPGERNAQCTSPAMIAHSTDAFPTPQRVRVGACSVDQIMPQSGHGYQSSFSRLRSAALIQYWLTVRPRTRPHHSKPSLTQYSNSPAGRPGRGLYGDRWLDLAVAAEVRNSEEGWRLRPGPWPRREIDLRPAGLRFDPAVPLAAVIAPSAPASGFRAGVPPSGSCHASS